MLDQITKWFEFLPNEKLRHLANELNDFILTYDLQTKYRYKVPFYYGRSWICYLNLSKNREAIEVNFIRANEFYTKAKLDFKGRKMVAGLEFSDNSNIDFEMLANALESAIKLDEDVKYKGVRK